jgi:hypothetical protein
MVRASCNWLKEFFWLKLELKRLLKIRGIADLLAPDEHKSKQLKMIFIYERFEFFLKCQNEWGMF